MIGDTRTRTLLAVLTQPHPTVRSVATAIDRSAKTTYEHLLALRDLDLLDWEWGAHGTLRATVTAVPLTARGRR